MCELVWIYKSVKIVDVDDFIETSKISLETKDEASFGEKREKALKYKNMELYKRIIDRNKDLWQNIGSDFWLEIFSGDSYEEVSFWVNRADRPPNLYELRAIKLEYNDLFQSALQRKDLDFDEEDIEEVVSELKDELSELKKAENAKIIKGPIDHSKFKGVVYEVDKNGIKSFAFLGEGPLKVILLDDDMKKVDFTKQKNLIQSRIKMLKKVKTL